MWYAKDSFDVSKTEPKDCTECEMNDALKNENVKLKNDVISKNQELERVNTEVTKHQKNGKPLKEKVKTLENDNFDKELTIKAQLGKITQLKDKSKNNETFQHSKPNIDIDSKLEAFSNNILDKVTKLMDEKLNIAKVITPVIT